MKKFKVKGLILTLVMIISIITLNSISLAADNNIGYKFTIKSLMANSYSSEKYRETTNPSNPWKVKLESSGEGKGTITSFWLARKDVWGDKVRASDIHNVKQGAKAKYSGAWKSANKSKVYLGAENNNNSYNTYSVSGYWDEETW